MSKSYPLLDLLEALSKFGAFEFFYQIRHNLNECCKISVGNREEVTSEQHGRNQLYAFLRMNYESFKIV